MFYKDYMDYKDLNSTKFTKVAAPGSLRLVVIFFTGHTVMNQKKINILTQFIVLQLSTEMDLILKPKFSKNLKKKQIYSYLNFLEKSLSRKSTIESIFVYCSALPYTL